MTDPVAAANVVETLHAEETQQVLPAIAGRRAMERAESSGPFHSLDFVLEQAARTTSVQGSTLRLGFDDATLRGNTMWLTDRRHRVLSRSAAAVPFGTVQKHPGAAVLAETPLAATYFGHWLRDDLLVQVLAEGMPEPSIRLNDPPYPHAKWYDQHLPGRPQTLRRATHFERLWVPVDNGQNRGKFHRYRAVRAGIAAALGLDLDADEQPGPVLLVRGNSGAKRTLVDEDEAVKLVERMGGRVLRPEDLAAEEVLRGLWNAPAIVAVEGSHLAPWVFAHAPHAALVLIEPPRRVNMLQKGVTECLGCPLGYVVAEPAGAEGAFRLDGVDELAEVVEAAVAQRGAARQLHETFHAATHSADAGG